MPTSDGESITKNELLSDLTIGFAETARILFSAGSVQNTLTQVVEVAVATIEGCDYAGILLMEGAAVTTPVHTDPVSMPPRSGSSSTPRTCATTRAGRFSGPWRRGKGSAVRSPSLSRPMVRPAP